MKLISRETVNIYIFFSESVSSHPNNSRDTLRDTKRENPTEAPVKLLTRKKHTGLHVQVTMA